MKENLLLHILSGEATSEEREKFYQYLENNKEEQQLFYELKGLWLRASFQQKTTDTDAEFEELWRKIKRGNKNTGWHVGRKILRYAAIAVFILSIGGAAGYFVSQKSFEYPEEGIQKYTATIGSVSIVEFPDGTKVWLNSESELTFREDRKNNQRLAELTGEAYFEVTHREDCPLIVKVGNLFVRDLGTTFNIKAYPGDNYIETSLVEGEADILTTAGNTIITLAPGESAMYHTLENKMELRTIADNVLSAWRDGKFVIRDQRLEDIFKELSRWYGIEFKFENEQLRDYRFTGNIKKSTTALHVLKMLRTATEFNYRIIENVDEPDIVIVY
jgi:ferric-dicitrate binding protein FerR (iron transport regulator)